MQVAVLAAIVAVAMTAGADGAKGDAATFSGKMQEFKVRYQKGKNEIAKSASFREAREFDRQFFADRQNVITEWKGKMGGISTSKGGDGLRFSVSVGRASFKQGCGFGEDSISREDPIYSQVAEFGEGECVIFSAEVNPTEQSMSEQGAMENPEYKVKFTGLKKCGSQKRHARAGR